MRKSISADKLFLEFSTTNNPFEKWNLFTHIPNDMAQLIYLPSHKQSHICNFQFGLYEKIKFGNQTEKESARKLTLWLLSHKIHVVNEFGASSPREFHYSLSNMIQVDIKNAEPLTRHLLLAFNPEKLTFKKPSIIGRAVTLFRGVK
ncbi:hypothetical protein [Yersinia aldovae]|uniref:hypothetical protein n=1 Tax=Yersinia aldovae TaxID=29483 RepID=UPI0011A64B28|nr:hypothetical protein [Yersinia aldovae]